MNFWGKPRAVWLLTLLYAALICLMTFNAHAQKAAPKGGVPAVVVTPGAIVYAGPNFDSEQITKFPQGRKIYTSSRTFGNEVTFYRVRVGDRIGYISTIDVNRSSDAVRAADRAEKDQQKGKKKSAKLTTKPQAPFFFTRYFGLSIGTVAFKEDITGVNANAQLTMFGLKLTGPDVMFSGPVVDFNFNIYPGVPSYYSALAQAKPTGFIIWTDALLMSPILVNRDKAALYLGIGPLLVYSSFRVINGDAARDLSALNMGLSIMGGVGGRFNKVGLRAEVKTYIERKQYTALQVAMQIEL